MKDLPQGPVFAGAQPLEATTQRLSTAPPTDDSAHPERRRVRHPPPDVRRLLLPMVLVGGYCCAAAAIMMTFLQGDIVYNSFDANWVALGHVDVYTYFTNTSDLRELNTVMPPLYYLLTGAYLKLLLALHADPVPTIPWNMWSTVFGRHQGLRFAEGILLLKLPNLVFVLLGLGLVVKLARQVGVSPRVAGVIWLLSPALIVTALMQAQDDVMAAAISAGALVAVRSRMPIWTTVLLGLAACFKSYTLLLVPVTALLISGRNPLQVVKLGLAGIVIPLAVVIPFWSHDFVHRVLLAHDSSSLLVASHIARLPVDMWVIAYVTVLVMAWIMSDREIGAVEVAAIWMVAIATVLLFTSWLPQWTLWLLPMVAILAARDRVLGWMWVGLGLLVLADDLVNYAGDMDGAMLTPIFGQGPHPKFSHLYLYHLYRLDFALPFGVRDAIFASCTAGFVALTIRAIQWLVSRRLPTEEVSPWKSFGPGWAALASPLLLIPYVSVMFIQKLMG